MYTAAALESGPAVAEETLPALLAWQDGWLAEMLSRPCAAEAALRTLAETSGAPCYNNAWFSFPVFMGLAARSSLLLCASFRVVTARQRKAPCNIRMICFTTWPCCFIASRRKMSAYVGF